MKKEKDTMKKIVLFAALAFAVFGSGAALTFYPQAALADGGGCTGGNC